MRKKRTSFEIQKEILQILSDGKERLLSTLRERCGTNYYTIIRNCHILQSRGEIKIIDRNGHKFARITERGKKTLELLK